MQRYSLPALSTFANFTVAASFFWICLANFSRRHDSIFSTNEPSKSKAENLKCCRSIRQAWRWLLSLYMGEGPLHEAWWIVSNLAEPPRLPSAPDEPWSAVQNFVTALFMIDTVPKTILKECQTKCLWLADTKWHMVEVCSSPLSAEGLLCLNGAVKTWLHAYSYLHNTRLFLKSVRSRMDLVKSRCFSARSCGRSPQWVMCTSCLGKQNRASLDCEEFQSKDRTECSKKIQ